MEKAMVNHCCHVLFSTDLNASASEIYLHYKNSTLITPLWESFAEKSLALPPEYFDKAALKESADGVITLMEIVAALHHILGLNVDMQF